MEGAGTTTFAYDDLNRQTSKTLPTGPYFGASGHSVEMAYDNAGNLATLGDATGTTQYFYTSRLLLDRLIEPNGGARDRG